jgi:hypothetical protein
MDIRKARAEFLQDTIDYYSVSPNIRRSQGTYRNVNGTVTPACYYRGPNGEKCAIGRHIPNELYHTAMEGKWVGASALIQCALPEEVLALGTAFLKEVQALHDEDRYWDDKGLSKSGEFMVGKIQDTFIRDAFSEEIAGLVLKAETIPEAPIYVDDIIDGFDMVSK